MAESSKGLVGSIPDAGIEGGPWRSHLMNSTDVADSIYRGLLVDSDLHLQA
jgi:hypothetical protein